MRIEVEPGSPEYDALAAALQGLDPVVLEIQPGWWEDRFEPGDPVRVPFDNGRGPATVIGADREYVRVKYGPGGKYTTSLGRTSVETANRVWHEPVLTVVT